MEYLTVLFFIFLLASLTGVLIYYIIFSLLPIHQNIHPKSTKLPPLSLIVCAKNEAENIQKNMLSWLGQDYPVYEVIVVDDGSTDQTKRILQPYKDEHRHVSIIHISKEKQKDVLGKRHALLTGIQASKYDYVVCTDADCMPASNQWLQWMGAQFSDTKEIVLGISPYTKEKGMLNAFIRLDHAYTSCLYTSFARIGCPYMATGRNIGYKKSLLNKEAFLKSNRSVSGDDDLLYQQIGHARNTTICTAEESIVFTTPKKSYAEWFAQKQRHLGAGRHYSNKKMIVPGLFIGINIMFYLSAAYLFFVSSMPITVLCIIFFKYVSQNITFYVLRHWGKHNWVDQTISFVDFLYWPIFLYNFFLTIIAPSKKW